MILNIGILLQGLGFFCFDYIKESQNNMPHYHLPPIALPNDYESVWPFMPKIAFAFEYQVYFMIVFPYLNTKRKKVTGTGLAVKTSSFMLLYCFLFSILSLGAR